MGQPCTIAHAARSATLRPCIGQLVHAVASIGGVLPNPALPGTWLDLDEPTSPLVTELQCVDRAGTGPLLSNRAVPHGESEQPDGQSDAIDREHKCIQCVHDNQSCI
jgi:hypothetical protein